MTSKSRRLRSYLVMATLAVFFLISCKNPLVGLGPRVDLTPPEGEVTGITNGDYVSGDITLTGTVEDDKQIAAVWAQINGSNVTGSFDAAGDWTIDVDTTDTTTFGSDGEKDITIFLKDTSGKITEKQMLLFFDNTPPVLMVTSPDLTSPQDTSPIIVRGEAYDPMRLDEVRAFVGQGSFTIEAPGNQGTADSWLFELSHAVSGIENFGLILEAVDRAGNVSQAVFHTKDLRHLNNDVPITVIDLYKLADNVDQGLVITPTDVDQSTVHSGLPSGSSSTHLTFGAGVSGLPIEVDMSGDIPQITVTTPNPNIAAPGDTMGPASKVNGSISDNVRVDETSLEIRFLDGAGDPLVAPDDVWSAWNPITVQPAEIINDQNVNFSYALPGSLPDANYMVQVRAQDNNGTTGTTALIPFRLDGNAPVIEITAPALSSYIPDSSTLIEGTVSDSEDILVEISLDGTNWETVGTVVAPGGPWSYQISDWEGVYGAGFFSDFDTIPISARATANGTTTYTNHSLILDRVAPTIEFLTPDDSRDEFGVITGDVNGVVTLRVAVSDDSLNAVSHKIGINGPVEAVDSGSLYNWSKTIVTTLMEDPNLATEISPGIWELPVTVTATDKAGNTTVTSDYTIIIDNAQDRPNVSLIYPIEGQSYGGEVVVSGIATDDDGTVGAVYVQVDLDTAPADTPDFAGIHVLTDGIDFDGNGAVTSIDESLPYQVTGLSSWSFPLNTTGELYDIDGIGDHDGDIYVKVWAEDPINATVTSVPQILHFRLDDTLPRIDQILLDGLVAGSNDYVSGNVDLEVTTSDDTQINKLEISYDNGVSWTDLGVTPAQSVVKTVTMDTAALVAGGNGILYLRLKATDNTGYTTLEVLPLNVDNNAPTGTYPGTEPIVLTGTEALLQGTASDPVGSIAGIERIEVYLERDVAGTDDIYNPLSTAYDYVTNYNPDIAAEETTFGAGNFYPVDPAGSGVMVVDDVNELGSDTVSGDNDGYDESLTLVASTWNWWVKFNSENIPDGDINIHYVVVDKAGNKTHYAKAARIENNPPVIESVKLGTDINYDSGVDAVVGNGETFQYIDGTGTDGSGVFYVDFDSVVSTITSRNSRLLVDADELATDGNGDPAGWLWELYYKGGGANLLGAGTDSTTITNFATMPDESGVSYTLRVTDDAGLSDEVEFLVSLDNDDATPPTVTLNDLDLSLNFTILARGGADNYGYAIPGYDPSSTPLWTDAQGRLRPVGSGVYNGSDADVSGQVIVSGIAADDKAIHEVEILISGYNGGLGAGNPFRILEWDTLANGGLGGLKTTAGVIGTPHISSESYGESTGHTVAWSFEFDTAAISTTAAADVRVTAYAQDKSSNVNTPVNDVSADNYTMDVMPFVTEVQRSDPATSPVRRTKYGSWPFPEGVSSPIWIHGFNLNPDSGSIRLENSTVTASEVLYTDVTVDSSKKVHGVLSTDDGGGGETAISHSGRLALEVNSIPLMNDFGDFDEDDGSHPDWNDDRYIEIWKVGDDFTNSAFGVYGAMAVDENTGSFMASWSNWSTASTYTAPQGGVSTVRFNRYDPPEYTDLALNESGTPYVAILANFLGGTWGVADSGGVGIWSTRASDADQYGGNAFEEADAFIQDRMLWQFRNPRIAVTGTDADTDIYMTYFDQASSALKFSHFKDVSANDSIYNLTLYPVALGVNDSTARNNSQTNNPNFIRDYDGNNIGLYDLNIIEDGTNSAYYGSWSDVAVDKRVNAPVILFSDIDKGSVRLMRATSMNPADHDVGNLVDMEFAGGNYDLDGDSSDAGDDAVFDWHPSQDVFSGDSYKYVSLAMDPQGNLHAAAYRVSTGELVYRFAPALTTTDATNSEAYVFGAVEVVDTDGNVGKWADLSLVNRDDDGAQYDMYPVISYLDSSWVGTYRGLKVARKEAANWEYGIVPVDTAVEDGRLSAIGSLYRDRITTDADDYEIGVGFHSTNYEYVLLRPEK